MISLRKLHLLRIIPSQLRCYSSTCSGEKVLIEAKKKQLKKLQHGLRRLLKDHNFPFGLDTNPKNIYVKQCFRHRTQQVVPGKCLTTNLDSRWAVKPFFSYKGLGSSAHSSHISNAKELYRQASVDWSEKLTESHKDEFRQLAHENMEVIDNW